MEKHSSKYAGLIISTLASFLVPFMASSINIALPAIEKDFAIHIVEMGWIATAYLLAAAVFMVPCGRLADIYGRKRIFFYGMVIYTIASILCGLSYCAVMLICFRIVQGIGCAMLFSTNIAILISLFSPQERGKVLGLNVAAVYSGLSAGPFLGGLLTHYAGWQSLFFINAPIGLVVVFLILYQLKDEWREAKGESFDYTGSIAYACMLICLMYGLSLLPASKGGWICLLGLFMLFVFIRIESRSPSPVFNTVLFKSNKVFAFSNLAALINYSATYAVTFLLSLYLQYIKQLSPGEAGLILVSQPIVMALFSPFAGKLSDKIEPRIVSSIGMAFTAIGLCLLMFLKQETALAMIIGNLIILGFGFALFSSPNTNAVMSSVEKKFYSIASATLGTMRLVGQMLSMGISMLVSSIYLGNVQITPAYYAPFLVTIKVSFLIFALLCFAGIFASLARGKVRQ